MRALLLLVIAGCVEPKPYRCSENRQCLDGATQGTCEANGACSFPDPACPSHQRYASAGAAEVAGKCTPKGGDCIVEILGGGTTEDNLDVGHTCVRKNDGSVWCWGDNTFGQLGGSSAAESAQAVQVPLPMAATGLASGELFGCALLMNGDVYCWGDNEIGQLGVGASPMTSATPLKVAAPVPAKTIGAGGGHACLVDTSGGAACWGENGNHQIGDGASDPQTTPFSVPGILRGDAIGAGDQHSCVLLDDTSVHCWGSNALGQLGQGVPGGLFTDPVEVTGLLSATTIRLGDQHTCALLTDSTLLCWGTNVSGTVGNGSIDNALAPVRILDGVTSVATSGDAKHTCVARIDGTLFCWGNNDSGQVGLDPAQTIKSPKPQQLPLSSVRLVGAGAHHSCAVTFDGTVWCWGSNHSGQLGLMGTMQENTPRRVPFSCN